LGRTHDVRRRCPRVASEFCGLRRSRQESYARILRSLVEEVRSVGRVSTDAS
jgi:hypothetical protein